MSGPRLLDLPHGQVAVIDEDDWPLVSNLTLYRGTNGYVYFSTWRDGKSHPQTLHNLLMGTHPGKHVDHINGNKMDNRRSNLRVVSPALNQINRKSLNRNNLTGIRGVNYAPHLSLKKPWRAQITANNKNRHLGLFATQEEAIVARKAAERDLYGEYCP